MNVVVFDAYGTLLDVHSPARRLADRLGRDWHELSVAWRTKQMEFTWVRTLSGQFTEFASLTRAALQVTLAAHGADPSLLQPLMDENQRLEPFADVAPALDEVRAQGRRVAILSNGSVPTLHMQLASARLADKLDFVLSASAVRAYKPDPKVYALATAHYGCAPGDLVFVSSNPWDAFGAHAFGFRVVWVNRDGKQDDYGLRGSVSKIGDLSALPALLAG